MAKSRRVRNRAKHSDPIAKPVKPPSDPQLAALRQERILPVLQNLQSSEPNKRTEAAGAIANIVQDEKCRKLLLREQVVHVVLTQTLTDASLESRAAGWEILKVLAQEEEADFCVHLYRSDVLSAAEHTANLILDTIKSVNPPFHKATAAQQQFTWRVVSSVTLLLNSLAEAREEILDAIASSATIRRLLIQLITSSETPSNVKEDALMCLMTVSEDNRDLAQALVDDQQGGCFPRLMEAKELPGAQGALTCGLLQNVFSVLEWHDHSPGRDGACDAILVPHLSQLLDTAGQKGETPDAGFYDVAQLVLDVLAAIGTDVQAALEKGNRDDRVPVHEETEFDGFDDGEDMADADDIETAPEDGEDDGDHEMGDDTGLDIDDAMDADMDMVTGPDDHDQHDDRTSQDIPPTLKQLILRAIPRIIPLARPQVVNDQALLVQMSALSALNNIAWTASCIDFSDASNKAIQQAWTPAARSVWKEVVTPILATDTADLSLARITTSLAWAVARTLNGDKILHGDEYRRFISLYKAAGSLEQEEDPFQSLGVKCIGVLGQIARHPAPLPLNRDIGVFLVSILAALPETKPAEVVEAMNQIFDIYGDEDVACDRGVFWKDGFLKHLEEVLPKARTMLKAVDKRTSAELRTRADEAVLNLNRFIGYKRKHAP